MLNLQFIFFLHSLLFTNEGSTRFSTLHNLDSKLFENFNSLLTSILLFDSESCNTNQNTAILNTPMGFFYQQRDLKSHFL